MYSGDKLKNSRILIELKNEIDLERPKNILLI